MIYNILRIFFISLLFLGSKVEAQYLTLSINLPSEDNVSEAKIRKSIGGCTDLYRNGLVPAVKRKARAAHAAARKARRINILSALMCTSQSLLDVYSHPASRGWTAAFIAASISSFVIAKKIKKSKIQYRLCTIIRKICGESFLQK
jgi:hypothetical protein